MHVHRDGGHDNRARPLPDDFWAVGLRPDGLLANEAGGEAGSQEYESAHERAGFHGRVVHVVGVQISKTLGKLAEFPDL